MAVSTMGNIGDDDNDFGLFYFVRQRCVGCRDRFGVFLMRFGFIASMALLIAAVIGVFIYIPIISNYAFWFVVLAYLLLAGST